MLTVIYRILLLYLSLNLVHDAIGFDECTPHPPCMCEYDDGRVIDLRPFANEDFIQGTKGNLTFFYHPCANKNLTIPNVDANVTQSCAGGTSLCAYDSGKKLVINFGKNEDAQLVQSVLDGGVYDVMFLDKKTNASHLITLVCTNIKETRLDVDLDYPKKHDLILFTHYACPHMIVHGLSTGSVLIIMLMILSGIYLFGGACILHFIRGARGLEMIPNIDFWRDLPLLVRDGVIFLQNGCKPPVQSAETYYRI